MKQITDLTRLLFLLALIASSSAQEAAPKLINYQGKLTDAVGAPLGGSAGGTYSLKFEVFDAPTGGTAAWGETRQVAVVDGVFNVVLGGAGGTNVVGDLGAAFAGKDRYLQTTVLPGAGVATQQVLLPRQQLASVPFALVAQNATIATNAISATNASNAAKLDGQVAAFYMPPGGVIAYGGTNEPTGWLICDGRAVSRTNYPALFAAIRTAHGIGDGTNTFNLPDYRGRFLRGASGTTTNDPDRTARTALANGGATGNNVGSYQGDDFRSHTHTYRDSTTGDWRGLSVDGTGTTTEYWAWAASQATGGNETRPVNVYVNYIIKY